MTQTDRYTQLKTQAQEVAATLEEHIEEHKDDELALTAISMVLYSLADRVVKYLKQHDTAKEVKVETHELPEAQGSPPRKG